MLTPRDNELLTRVGPGTALGSLMRRYWLPALPSADLEADGRPMRVRLLSQDLVVFRDSRGSVGVLDEFCPHRQVSLFFARNEASGLRCVYHGWKFDVHGRCVDLPSEPPDSPMRDRVAAQAWPCAEHGGLVWTYLGEGAPPPLPDFEWALVPPAQRYASRRLLECNWAQGLEGDIDSSHASFLHAMLDPQAYASYDRPARALYMDADGHPRYEVDRTPYGLVIGARRGIEGGERHYWRVAQYIVPFTTMPAPYEDELYRCNIWVPRDDVSTMTFVVDWHPSRALTDRERETRGTGLTAHCHEFEPGAQSRPRANRDNDYLFRNERQREDNYSGIREIWAQDKAVVESMGPVMDRSREHLGSSDKPLVEFRKLLLAAVKSGGQPGQPSPAASMLVRSASFTAGAADDWRAVASEHTRAGVGIAPHPQTV